ncbi:unnamed protein product [Prunus brigantina]
MVIGDVDSGASAVISVALFLSFACALVFTMSLLANVPLGVPKVLTSQISRPGAPGRRDVREHGTSFFWIRCVLCAGVLARSTVRRDFDRVWIF